MRLRAVLAQNVKRHRLRLGLSQEHLAHRANLTVAYVSAIEREKPRASIDTIEKLAGALQITPAELLTPEPEPEAKVKRQRR
jgi:transcriptional regulator with XRE-family HTH domain